MATEWCTTQERGPVYLRLGKAGEPVLTAHAVDPWEFGKLRYLSRGRDVCILSYGPTVKLASEIGEWFTQKGRSVSLASVHTLKPLDVVGIREALTSHEHVLVIEELAPNGSLGQQVKAIAWDAGAKCRLDTFSLDDAFHHVFGSHGDLLAAHGLNRETILARLEAA
jgi:transketolase